MPNIKNEKEEKRTILLKSLGLPKSTRAIVLSYIKNPELKIFLREASESLGIAFLTGEDASSIEGADAFILDEFSEDIPLRELIQSRTIPIIPVSAQYDDIFKEFNPMKFEGNAFLFNSPNKYLIFEKLVRFLENIRYPGDRRTLLQNLEKTVL